MTSSSTMGHHPSIRPWLAVASIAIGAFAMVTTEFLPIGLLSAIAADMGVSEGSAGLMVTVPGIAAAIAAPVLTVAAGSIDRRIFVVVLTALIVLSNVVAVLAPSFGVMLLGRVLLGLCIGGFWTFSAAIGRRLVTESAGGRATAIIIASISVATVAGVPAGALIGEWAGWRSAFLATAVLSVAALIGQALLLPKLPATRVVRVGDIFALFAVRQARIGLLATALIVTGHFAAYTYLEPFLKQVVALSPSMLSGVLAAYGVAGLLGTFAAEKALDQSLRVGFAGVMLLLSVALFLAMLFGGHSLAAIAFVTLWGLAFGGVPLGVQLWLYAAAPERFEIGSAMMVTVFQVALALGAFTGGVLVDGNGINSAFIAGSLLALAAALTFFAGSRGDKTSDPSDGR
ncbi:MFS transporter [Devosia sp. 1566]|uniref:MFS transporter n=1 Tax=Devosia sp. 1566 TaxID=2499144 RepID=UPI0019D1830A|nr:MFS transporter [Devosia sp. 1566]